MNALRREEAVESMARAIWARQQRRWLEAATTPEAAAVVRHEMPHWTKLGEAKRLELRQDAEAALLAFEVTLETHGKKLARWVITGAPQ